MKNEKMVFRIFKKLSIFLVFAMVIGLFHTEATFAKKTAKKAYDKIAMTIFLLLKKVRNTV